MNGVRATDLPGLQQFKGQVFGIPDTTIPGAGINLDDWIYFDDTPLFSSGRITLENGGVAKGHRIPLFHTPVGAVGQGHAKAMVRHQTNLQGGQSRGKMPANQAYIALDVAFTLQHVSASGFRRQLTIDEAFELGSACLWSWNVGGPSKQPVLSYGPIKSWMAESRTAEMRFPLFFRPAHRSLFEIEFADNVSTDAMGWDVGDSLDVASHLTGYMLSYQPKPKQIPQEAA